MQKLIALLLLAGGLALAGCESTGPAKADLGQVVEQGRVSPVDGLTAAGQPDAAALGVFASSGYAAVIDMRTAGEDRGLDEPATVTSLGMEYVAFPIGGDDITFDKAAELDTLLQQYDEPVLLHCGSGNRVGALLALREFAKSGDAEQAIQTGRDRGLTSLEDKVRSAIDEAGGQ